MGKAETKVSDTIKGNVSKNLIGMKFGRLTVKEKTDCRWVTWKEQANNKTTNHYVEYNGYRYTLSQWSKILQIKISPTLLKYRIDKLNWSIEDAFNKPVGRFNNNEKRRN